MTAKQQEAQQWKAYIQGQFAPLLPKQIDAIQKAAIAWRNGDSAYYEYIQGVFVYAV